MKETTRKILNRLFERFPRLNNCEEETKSAVELIVDCYKNNRKLLICGNGGSASDSLHIVGELMKSFVLPRKLKNEYTEKIKEIFPENAEY